MKRLIWLTAMAAGGAGLCMAQDLARTDVGQDAEVLTEQVPWRVQGGLVYKNWLYEHDALQQRVPVSSDLADEWEDGDTDGSGWGIQTRIGRGDGWLNLSFIRSDFSFENSGDNWRHVIDTDSRDFEASWSQIRGRNEQAEWGSTLGFRYLGMQKDVEVREGKMTVDGSGNINWIMLLGGYDGHWRPFITPTFQFHGFLHFFLGEADGTARSGEDEDWTDGVVTETYDDEYSLAYGARARFGLDVALTGRVRLLVDYMREWLYSFDSTDSGVVVFPDNDDALFIENSHALVAGLTYLF